MGRHTRIPSLVAGLTFLGFSHWASGEEAKRPTLALLVYNYAGVQVNPMRRASEKVVLTFREAGVHIVWIEPLADSGHTMVNPSSNSFHMFTVQMLIRTLGRHGRTSTRASVLGAALGSDENGGTLSLFYDQVLRIAQQYSQPIDDVLALAIAHEMGHVLLPKPAHSNTGIMRAEWDGDEIRHAVVGSLAFTPVQTALIRSKVDNCCLDRAK